MRYSTTIVFTALIFFTALLRVEGHVVASEVIFTPPRYYMGDLVTLQFKIKLEDHSQELSIPVYGMSEYLTIEKIMINKQELTHTVTITFRAYTVGASFISLNFGAITVEPIGYYVSSLVEERGRELRSAYGPKLLIGTRLIIAMIVMLVILLPPLLYFSFYASKHLIHRLIQYIRSPYRQFSREITRLYREALLSDKVFYFNLLESFRTFLSLSSGMKEYRSATEGELSELLRLYFSTDETIAIISLYQRGDLVKFGGNQVSSEQRTRDVDLISSLGQVVYKNGGIAPVSH